MAMGSKEDKLFIQTNCILLKNWPCVIYCLLQEGLVGYIYVNNSVRLLEKCKGKFKVTFNVSRMLNLNVTKSVLFLYEFLQTCGLTMKANLFDSFEMNVTVK